MTHVLVVFGKPGVGKTFVAHILHTRFGYYPHDGDTDLPEHMRVTLFQKGVITDSMRRQFLANMIGSAKKLKKHHDRIVIHQTFLKEFMRKEFLAAVPDARFIFVDSDDRIREKRYLGRAYFNLGPEYLRSMTELFEPPTITHDRITNDPEGATHIVNQLQALLTH